jgi:predicted Fe-S protein YdhL (DUF1289 family)
MDAVTGLCTGCGRTLDEIATWSSLTDQQREAILAVLPTRLEVARLISGVAVTT